MLKTIDTEVSEAHGVKIGDLFTDHVQPYGSRTIRIERIVQRDPINPPSYMEQGAWYELHGTVTEGKETSRLFQHTSTRDIAGRFHTVYGVRPRDFAKGEKTTIAM
jgi:hypothetical protein